MRIAHLAVELRARHEGSDRVDHDHIDGIRAHQHLRNLQRLLAAVGLRDEEVVDVDAELLGIFGVERVLGVDERRQPAHPLRLGDDVQRERRLARRLRPEDLHDPAPGYTSDAQCRVDADRAGGN